MKTDYELKRLCAEMLPDLLACDRNTKLLYWIDHPTRPIGTYQVDDLEMLHIAHLIEETLSEPERLAFMRELIPSEFYTEPKEVTNGEAWEISHAGWKKRIAALAKRKDLHEKKNHI